VYSKGSICFAAHRWVRWKPRRPFALTVLRVSSRLPSALMGLSGPRSVRMESVGAVSVVQRPELLLSDTFCRFPALVLMDLSRLRSRFVLTESREVL
jgi:hypothetical protein